MAGKVYFSEDGWSLHEISVFKLNTQYQPPFYVKTVDGIYDTDEELCFSAGDEYIILHKLKIKSVIATTIHGTQRRISLKIPLDYTGKFHPIGEHEALLLRDIVTTKLPKDVNLGNSRQHSSVLLEKLGHNNHCTLRLSEEVLDDYFLGKSKDGQLVFLFSPEMNMNFLVKKVTFQDVKHLLINMADLKYDIFILNKDKPTMQVMNTKDAVQRAPPRPPKPKPGRSPKSPDIPPNHDSPQSTPFSYEVTPLTGRNPNNPEQPTNPNSSPTRSTKFSYEVTTLESDRSPKSPEIPPNQDGSQGTPFSYEVTPLTGRNPKTPEQPTNQNGSPFSYEVTTLESDKSPKSPEHLSNQNSPRIDYEVTDIEFEKHVKKPTALQLNGDPQASLPREGYPPVSPKPPGNLNMKTLQSPADKHNNVTNIPEPSGKQNILLSFPETDAAEKRLMDRDFPSGGSNTKPVTSPRVPPIPTKPKKKPKPPPLPSSPHPVSDESAKDTDEEYDTKVQSTQPAAPRGTQTAPPPLPPSFSPHLRHHDRSQVHSDKDTDDEYNGKVPGKPAVPRRQVGIGAVNINNIPPPRLPPPSFPSHLRLSPPRQVQSDIDTDEEYNQNAATPVTHVTMVTGAKNSNTIAPPPPLPPSLSPHLRLHIMHPDSDLQHVQVQSDNDNDEDYNATLTRHYKEKERSDSDSDDGDEYLQPTSTNADDSSDSDLPDYERITDEEDYERLDQTAPTPTKTPPAAAYSPTASPTTTKKRFNIKITKKFSKLHWKRPPKQLSASGNVADDELTEDPYAEQNLPTRVSTKKRYRSPHDKLPMPQPEPLTLPPSFDLDRPRMPPPSADSDSDELSDYEHIDDDKPQQPLWSGQRVPPTMPIRSHSERSNDYGQQHPMAHMGQSMKHGFTKPNPLQQVGLTKPLNVVQPSHVTLPPQPTMPTTVPQCEEFPSELCNLSVEAIADTLLRLKIPEDTVDKFRASEIDGQIFVCIDDSILDQLGVGPLHKLKIIKFKNGWRPNHT